ncbi:MAG: D-lactate dehydrogenase [Paraglaciecola sp.]|jgi:D-lactate dehydrogenase
MIDSLTVLAVDGVELMVQLALNSVRGKPGVPNTFCDDGDSYTALLIVTRADSDPEFSRQMQSIS